jgi:hypothetical protein
MSKKKLVERNDWFPDALPALIRARKRAEETARRTRTALVVSKGGKPITVRPVARNGRKPP